jgi:preprotein translocase subunit YajC
MTSGPARYRRTLATSPFTRKAVVEPSTAAFEVGDRVTLDSCGLGRVLSVSETHVTIDFGETGIRRVAAGTRGFSRL